MSEIISRKKDYDITGRECFPIHTLENRMVGDLVDTSSTETAVSVSKQSIGAMKSLLKDTIYKGKQYLRKKS